MGIKSSKIFHGYCPGYFPEKVFFQELKAFCESRWKFFVKQWEDNNKIFQVFNSN